jgi:hypothetical protein
LGNQRLGRDKVVIVCEGITDEAFFTSLLAAREISGFQVIRTHALVGVGGDTAWTEALNALIAEPNFERLQAIIVVGDNDSEPARKFQLIRAAIAQTTEILSAGTTRKLDVPEVPLVRAGNAPGVVIMMIPWTEEHGNLETLCFRAVRAAFPAKAACVDEFAVCTSAEGWPISHRSKMQVRSYLASGHQSKPEFGLTRVWKEAPHLIPLENAAFDQIAAFLRTFGTQQAAPA